MRRITPCVWLLTPPLPPLPLSKHPCSGFGFVTFATKEEAQSAIDALNETELDGRTIRVNFAQPRDPNAPRPPRRGAYIHTHVDGSTTIDRGIALVPVIGL